MTYQLLRKTNLRIQKYFPPKLGSSSDDPDISRLRYFAIRGFAKSGTNWLSNLMNLHPQVFSAGEFGFAPLSEARDYFSDNAAWTVCNSAQMKGRLDQAFETMIKRLMLDNAQIHRSVRTKSWLGDKTPSRAYPPTIKHSKCLYIIRDVRDITVSRAYHLLRVKGTWGLNAFPKMLKKMEDFNGNLQYFKDHPSQLLDDVDWVRDNVRSWAEQVEQVIGAESAHWQERYPDYAVKVVYYEDLHTDVEGERNRCYEFLNLDASLALPLDSGPIKTSPGFSSERPQAFYRKGAIGDWKNYFNENLEAIVYEEAGKVLKRAGYLE